MLITVFTPTYNRGYKIKDLFESLMQQTKFNFEWLIIDDGSDDNTHEIVKTFNSNGKFKIRYIFKENGGKHTAINLAANKAQGEYVFIVDSDDILTTNAIEIVSEYLNSIKNDNKFCGVVGLRGNIDGKVLCTNNIKLSKKTKKYNKYFNNEYIDATPIEYRYKYKIQGDRAEVIKTDILKKYPFPVFENEYFMPEGYLWLSISIAGYKFRWFNEIIYITEYLDDGLTKNGLTLSKTNWKSRCFIDNFTLGTKGVPLINKFKSCVNYYRYGLYGNQNIYNLFMSSNNKLLSLLSIPIALITSLK